MAALSASDLAFTLTRVMQFFSQTRETLGAVKKADLQAAINALDAFLDTNAATINAAIPQPARGALTQAQKARLLSYVIEQRYMRGL
jgi:hypothetical protein